MRQRPRRFEALHAAVDAGGLEDADQDRERARPVDFLEIDHLLIVDLADDDPGQFHRDGHGGDPFNNAGRWHLHYSVPHARIELGGVLRGKGLQYYNDGFSILGSSSWTDTVFIL